MSNTPASAEEFMALVGRIAASDARLSGLQAGLLAAASLDIAHDSRSFSRLLGVEHALVIRELTGLEDLGLIEITHRQARTLRSHFRLAS